MRNRAKTPHSHVATCLKSSNFIDIPKSRSVVSIVIPVKNRIALLLETIQSVAAQTYPYIECLIVDNNSAEAIEEPARNAWSQAHRSTTLSTREFFYCRLEEGNGNAARNLGLARAKGDYLIFLDSDDLLPPDRVASSVAVLDDHPNEAGVVFETIDFLSETGEIVRRWKTSTVQDDLEHFLKGFVPWITGAPTWRTKAIQQAQGWNELLPKKQDWEFHLRLLASGAKIRKTSKVGLLYRRHDDPARVLFVQEIGSFWFYLFDAFRKIGNENKSIFATPQRREAFLHQYRKLAVMNLLYGRWFWIAKAFLSDFRIRYFAHFFFGLRDAILILLEKIGGSCCDVDA